MCSWLVCLFILFLKSMTTVMSLHLGKSHNLYKRKKKYLFHSYVNFPWGKEIRQDALWRAKATERRKTILHTYLLLTSCKCWIFSQMLCWRRHSQNLHLWDWNKWSRGPWRRNQSERRFLLESSVYRPCGGANLKITFT